MHSYGDWGYLGLGVDAASQPGLGPSPWRSALGTMVGLAKGVPWAVLQVRWDLVTAPPESLSPPVMALPSLRRWQQSVKSSGLASNLQPSGAKADALREEMEEAANRVEICRVPGRPGGIAPSWGGGTSASRAQRKTCSLSSFPVLHPFLAPLPVINPPPAGPCAWWQWGMLTSQAGHPRFLCPHPPYPTRAGEHPLAKGLVPAGAGELSTACAQPWHRDPREGPACAQPTRATRPRPPLPSRRTPAHPVGHIGREKHPSEGGRWCRRLRRGLRASAIKPPGNFVWL